MKKSKHWKATITPGLAGEKFTVEVSGEINTGNIKMKPTLVRGHQGITETQLILVANPFAKHGEPEHFSPVSFKHDEKHDYRTILITDEDGNSIHELKGDEIKHPHS